MLRVTGFKWSELVFDQPNKTHNYMFYIMICYIMVHRMDNLVLAQSM